jgi:hypothetical protein
MGNQAHQHMSKTFILNDETKKNSFGFRTLNAGIDLQRFRSNPVILANHKNDSLQVIGRWENIRLEGSQILADAVFDEEDEQGKLIAGKVERGFLKGCSMGLNPDWTSLEKDPTDTWVMHKCELMEASIVAVPSNSLSITLYSEAGLPLQNEEITLKLSAANDGGQIPKNMNKLVLSAIALVALGIQTTDDPAQLAAAIEGLAKKNTDLAAELQTLKDAAAAQVKLRATALVDKAIVEGKLSADVKDNWIKLAEADIDGVAKTIEGLKGATSLGAQVQNSGANAAVKTEEDFMKLSHEDKVKFKEENPEAYAKLFA